MRHMIVFSLCLGGVVALSACEGQMTDEEVERAVAGVNAIDATGLNDIMLQAGDPNEAVAYFSRAVQESPDRIDLKRGLAQALVRAKKPAEAARVWAEVAQSEEATADDQVNHADALIRAGDWAKAEDVLKQVPPTVETYDRYRLEAMVADAGEDWKKADSFYETAVGLTTSPARILNNWGYSKLTRGDFPGAEKLFLEALTYDEKMFTAKNNLMMARGAQRNYDLPVLAVSQVERAQLLHTLALAAIKQGDLTMGKTLLEEAIDTHPQHFDPAVRALRALESNVQRG
ncbi:lipopolysaccharide assembly protein LapB [Maritimibacter sp. HL-12]|jgi:Flp pilus assembly protein TadD|uniref:tetratricopeptide repeat protein n=1 Tax=Maritimibacter sp. HL-12 TaxID=1162418 RepID=UPI000A0F055A|nr:tetratricopeptide repeat protein [Maritimibacter sp. HL-12]SMH53024.1 Flp pilus assembly protein TadD, contains TPR repeats [Maritimibacter sp. HL-12]